MRYLTLGVGFYLSLSASFPHLIYTLARGTVLSLSTVFDFLLFAFALYLLSRLFELLPQDNGDTHAMVKEAADEQEASLSEGEESAPDASADDKAEALPTEEDAAAQKTETE